MAAGLGRTLYDGHALTLGNRNCVALTERTLEVRGLPNLHQLQDILPVDDVVFAHTALPT